MNPTKEADRKHRCPWFKRHQRKLAEEGQEKIQHVRISPRISIYTIHPLAADLVVLGFCSLLYFAVKREEYNNTVLV
jgi:hypothetical protein